MTRRGVYPPHGSQSQTDDCGNIADGLFDGHGDTMDGDQTDDCRCLVFG